MKKLLTLLCALTLVLPVTMSASAELVTITFDEEGISAGGCPPQGAGDLITDQYAPLGVNWIVSGTDPNTDNTNEVTRGECFNNAFDIGSDNQILWYTCELKDPPLKGDIQLDFLANYLAFDHRRPAAQARPLSVDLYNGADLVTALTAETTGEWRTFEYDGSSGSFDRIVMSCGYKFVIDNLVLNRVTACTRCDLNGDGVCDEQDLATFANSPGWGRLDCNLPEVDCICDLNDDGTCNALDGEIFTEALALPQCKYGFCSCYLHPDDTVIERGGTLGFNATVTNETDKTGTVFFARKVTLPNGALYPASGYLFAPVPVGLAPYQPRTKHLSQPIPQSAPLGRYTYLGYVGLPGGDIIGQCEFEFEVVEAAPF